MIKKIIAACVFAVAIMAIAILYPFKKLLDGIRYAALWIMIKLGV
ncbi:MAG: hypothetical protein ACW987_18565 [Candidatus Thorarchaeota archaeon]|jgi:hypothetical protein